MDNELQHLRQSVDSPERTMQHHQSPARVEGHILSSAQSPVGEVSPAEQDLPNPPSYFLRGHDGKMRFFGLPLSLP